MSRTKAETKRGGRTGSASREAGAKRAHKAAPWDLDGPRIFSGEGSREMWGEVNGARTVADLRSALFGVCCLLQHLEARVAKLALARLARTGRRG